MMFLSAKSECTICREERRSDWVLRRVLLTDMQLGTSSSFHHFGAQVLHGQSDVVGGDGEEALQLGVRAQVDPVGLQEGPQSAVAHVLHDENVRLCAERGVGGGSLCRTQLRPHTGDNSPSSKGLSPSVVFQSSSWRTFLWCISFLMMETSVFTCLGRTPEGKKSQVKSSQLKREGAKTLNEGY